MNKGAIAFAGLGLGLVVLGTRKTSWPGVPYSPTAAPPLPNPAYVPAVYVPPVVIDERPGNTAPPLAVPPASIMSRVVTAASSGNPTTMRAEAALLRAQGWPDQAGDLEELARRTDQLRAAVSPVPVPAPVPVKPPPPPPVKLPAPEPVPVKLPPAPAPVKLPPVSPPLPTVVVKPPVVVPVPRAPDPRPPVVPPGQPQPGPVSMLGLKKGATPGEAVTAWQRVLREDGFGDIPVDSNTFGPQTDDYTRSFQLDRGLTPTGIVDQQTLNLVTFPAIVGKRTLQSGSRGGAVKAWQRVLVDSGQTEVVVDGWFAGQTIISTKYWQKARGLEPDGKVGPGTIGKMGLVLVAKSLLPVTMAAVTEAVQAIYPTTFDPAKWRKYLKSGMVGDDVSEWQTVLSRDGFVSHPDGKFGPETIAATKAWQLSRKLSPVDGVVGPDVRARIDLKPGVFGPDSGGTVKMAAPIKTVSGFDAPTAWREFKPTAPLPGMPLQAPSEQVSPERALAAKLAANLFFSVQGGEDKALVRLFQQVTGLQATGAYGPSTAEALIAYGLIPPHPRAWPSKGSTKVRARYVATLREQARRDPTRAVEWTRAAERAVGQ